MVGGVDAPEARFADERLERCWRGAAVYCLCAATLVITSAAYDGIAARHRFNELLPMRGIVLVAIAAVARVLALPFGRRWPRELVLVLMAVMSTAMHVMAQRAGHQLSAQYGRLVLPMLGAAVLMSWSAAWAALSSLMVIGPYVIGSAIAGELHSPRLPGNLVRLAVAGALAMGISIARERTRRRELLLDAALASTRAAADAQIRQLAADLERQVRERTAALSASEARFRAMFEAAPIGVVAIDVEGRLLQANDAFAKMISGAVPSLLGRSLVELVDGTNARERLRAVLEELGAPGRTSVPFDVRGRRGDGRVLVLHGAFAAIRGSGNTLRYALGMLEDVTDRVHAEEQARDHRERLARAQRLAAMGGLLAELTHELNQPLGAILNYANGTRARLERHGGEPAVIEAVASIAAQAVRASEILRRVRGVVRPRPWPIEDIDLNTIVREVAQSVRADAEHEQIQLRIDLAEHVPLVSIDRLHAEQVVLNLLHNSIEGIRTEPGTAHTVTIRTGVGGAGVEVQVRDTGPGVPDADMRRIFEAFFTTKPGALGMGLPVSRAIVEAYGGQLWARRNPDRGMAFGFTLPALGGAARPQ